MHSETRAASPEPSAATSSAGLVIPIDCDVQQIDFDQLLRYSAATEHLDCMLAGAGSGPIRILEVGPNVLNLLPRFLDPGRIQVTRCDVIVPEGSDPDFVLIEKNKPLPFANDEFDAVVSLEVLEHIPRPERKTFISECVRVARQGVVITCPNGIPEVAACERVASTAYFRRHGTAHPFLCEHVEFGLPREEEVRAILAELGHPHAVMNNAPLSAWLVMLLLCENLVERQTPADLQMLLRELLVKPAPAASPAYRKIYLCAKSAAAAAALPAMTSRALAMTTAPQGAGNDERLGAAAVAVAAGRLNWCDQVRFRDTLGRLEVEFARACLELTTSAERHEAAKAGVLPGIQLRLAAASEQIRGISGQCEVSARAQGRLPKRGDWSAWGIKSCLFAVRHLLGEAWRMGRRQWTRWMTGQVYDARALLPVQDVVVQSHPRQWFATGKNARMVLRCRLNPGALRLRLRLRTDSPGRVDVCLDSGADFNAGERVELARVHNQIELNRVLCLDKPVAAVRFDFTGFQGVLQLETCTLEQPAEWRVATAAVWAKLQEVRRGRGLLSLLKGAARLVLRGNLSAYRARCVGSLTPPPTARDPQTDYQLWRAQHQLTAGDRERMRAEAAAFVNPPCISILLPAAAATADQLATSARSVLAQLSPYWELCIAQPDSAGADIVRLVAELAAADGRVKPVAAPGDAAAACTAALAAASGDFVCVLAAGDALAEQAVHALTLAIIEHREVDLVYSDEDRFDSKQGWVEPFFKPDWSPEYLLACMYIQNAAAYRTALVRELGGYRSEFAPAHEYDLALRVAARTTQIQHVADVLYHRQNLFAPLAGGPAEHAAARRAVQAHLLAAGRKATVEPGLLPGVHRVRYDLVGQPLVSIVIPTGCGRANFNGREDWFVAQCVASIRQKSTWKNCEIIVLDNNDMPPALERELRQYDVQRAAFVEPFNLAAKMNLGARLAQGEQLVFLNDDIEVISPEWIESMLEFSQQPEIGAVGAKLLFPDGRLQHVGVTILAGNPGHHYYRFAQEHQGYFLGNVVHRNYSAVTGACMMTPAALFREVGGFDVGFPLNYNDVDYCLKVRATGRRIVYTPFAVLFHHESVTKSGVYAEELARFKNKWCTDDAEDPYYNPNLSTTHNDYSIGLSHAA